MAQKINYGIGCIEWDVSNGVLHVLLSGIATSTARSAFLADIATCKRDSFNVVLVDSRSATVAASSLGLPASFRPEDLSVARLVREDQIPQFAAMQQGTTVTRVFTDQTLALRWAQRQAEEFSDLIPTKV